MQLDITQLPDVICLTPREFIDERGSFSETWNANTFREATGLDVSFVQDNQSRSARGVIRGLHYQIQQPQGKLVRVASGAVFDVAVDIRKTSPTFGQWVGGHLDANNRAQLWVPAGFAHGFMALEDDTQVLYKTTDYYAPQHERTIAWDDPDLSINWPSEIPPLLSEKDAAGERLVDADVFAELPKQKGVTQSQ